MRQLSILKLNLTKENIKRNKKKNSSALLKIACLCCDYKMNTSNSGMLCTFTMLSIYIHVYTYILKYKNKCTKYYQSEEK